MGDIVNSDPLFVGSQDLGYSTLPEGSGTASYSNHIIHKKANQEMLYVGANDGMLHGFQVGIAPPAGTQEGQEIFAYIPNAVISPELKTLTDKNYSHKYFVDGAPQFGDAFYDSAWHTVLLGSMGAASPTEQPLPPTSTGSGGRAVFALDITTPASFSTSNVLWEFSNRNDADLGFTLSAPSVIRTYSTTNPWQAVVANGYPGTTGTGKAVLYFLDIKTGAVIKKIEAESTSGTNGLSTPAPIDVDGDQIVDYIYAGDLKGNMWKFDVTSNDATQWKVAYPPQPAPPAAALPVKPLFIAKDAANVVQPITVKPSVVKAAGAGQNNSGVMVYFGTGQYFEEGDHQLPTDPQIQTFYGIWDICTDKTNTTCDGVISGGRGDLVEQKITNEVHLDLVVDQDVRVTTACEVAYGTQPPTSPGTCSALANRKGWFMDLIQPPSPTKQGERIVSSPIVRGNTVIFTTLIPINAECEPSGTGWLMELDINGARFTGAPFDINGDGLINDGDINLLSAVAPGKSASGIKSTVGIIETPTIVGGNTTENKFLNGSSSEIMRITECPPGGCVTTGKRISWRQFR